MQVCTNYSNYSLQKRKKVKSHLYKSLLQECFTVLWMFCRDTGWFNWTFQMPSSVIFFHLIFQCCQKKTFIMRLHAQSLIVKRVAYIRSVVLNWRLIIGQVSSVQNRRQFVDILQIHITSLTHFHTFCLGPLMVEFESGPSCLLLFKKLNLYDIGTL